MMNGTEDGMNFAQQMGQNQMMGAQPLSPNGGMQAMMLLPNGQMQCVQMQQVPFANMQQMGFMDTSGQQDMMQTNMTSSTMTGMAQQPCMANGQQDSTTQGDVANGGGVAYQTMDVSNGQVAQQFVEQSSDASASAK